MGTAKKRVTISLSPDHEEYVKSISEKTGKSLSGAIQTIIEVSLSKNSFLVVKRLPDSGK